MVKFAEKFGEKLYDLLWVFHTIAKSGETNHVSVQQSNIIKDVNNPLVVFNSSQYVVRHKLWEQIFCFLDLNIYDSFVVVLFALRHFSEITIHDNYANEYDVLKWLDDVLDFNDATVYKNIRNVRQHY